MATQFIISMEMIYNYYGQFFANAIKKGENALRSGHLKEFSYDPENLMIRGKVYASQCGEVYDLYIEFEKESTAKGSYVIKNINCKCTRGLVVCSHSAAVLMHAWRNVSVTDKPCSWSKKNKLEEKNLPITIDDFRKKKKLKIGEDGFGNESEAEGRRKQDYVAIEFSLNDEEKNKINSKIKGCDGAAASLAWLLSKEPEPSEVVEDDSNGNTVYLTQPRDIILTGEYQKETDKMKFLMYNLRLTEKIILDVAEATTGQRDNHSWFLIKEWRLTASNFGDILHCYKKRNGPTPAKSLLQKLYAPKSIDKVKPVQWGTYNEIEAKKKFFEKYKVAVEETGLWLDESGILGASPDGLIGSDSVLEIKCPFKHRLKKLPEALTDPKEFIFYTPDTKRCKINREHNYWHQVQGQLYCTKRMKCYFMLYTTASVLYVTIPIDQKWQMTYVPLLKKFYIDYFIPFVRKMEAEKTRSLAPLSDVSNIS